MKHKLRSMLLSGALAGAMLMTSPIGTLKAAAESKAPYISEVFIAYGKTEDEAKQWLINNGWEPVDGNFNSGKGANVASVMGIKRTADPNDAVTDMAVMNMSGGYSFDDYDSVVQQKKAEIDEFIRSFIPVLEEYRANYRGEGSEGGQKRAQYAHDLLNKFYDGEIGGDYAVHDTGKPIGDLLLEKTRLEYGESNHDALPKNEQIKYGDLQQIILESSTMAVTTIERTLALASDAGQDTWLDRLEGLSGEALLENIGNYVPEAAGRDVSPSVALTYLNTHFGDAAAILSEEYFDIQNKLIWYISYNDANDLWQWDGETDEDYHARVDAYFENLQASNVELYENDIKQYSSNSALFEQVYNVSYEGEWGDTLGDFFNPQNGGAYNTTEAFLPIAAALSPGQRAGIQFLSLETLLNSALDSDAVMDAQFASVDELFGDLDSISVYNGINRGIFRKGVALTSEALMQKNMGNDPYNIWDEAGAISIASYCGIAVGAVSLVVSSVYAFRLSSSVSKLKETVADLKDTLDVYLGNAPAKNSYISDLNLKYDYNNYLNVESQLDTQQAALNKSMKSLNLSRAFACIGAALMLISAAFKIYQLVQFYNRTFTMIPMMIVDEADIVTYLTDDNGNPILDENGQQKKEINFDQFAYYQVVKCNRQVIGINPKAQDGVSDYESWGCGDAADLNCDVGKQWLALYTNKSRDKGDPILADSLLMQYGNDVQPNEYTNCLHYFCYTYAADLADDAYAFSNETNGIYMFWKSDESAFTASTFSKGYIALAAIGGLVAGILGTSVVMAPKRKKNIPDAPVAV